MTRLLIVTAVIGASRILGAQQFAVNAHRLFLQCEGQASAPTVVLLAGAGATTATWDKVQRQISLFAEVCSYDRAGLGKSDPAGEQPQSAPQIVEDLAALLQAAQIQPPYVLVGHSIGGIYARLFDEQHDTEVAGMVLVDSSHEEQIWRFANDEPKALSEYPQWQNQSVMSAQGFLPPEKRLEWRFDKPLIVIEHAIPPDPVWHKMQKDLASRSPKSEFITATHSSHYIQKIQPELVIAAVHSVVAQARQR